MSYLVDTNVLSELARRHPDPGVVQWFRGLEEVSVSVVTLEEMLFGLSWKPAPRVEKWLLDFLGHAASLLDVTPQVARQSGRLRGRLQAAGRVREQADMLIAATASVHGLILATRNTADFDGCGVAVFNPFS